MTIPVEKLMAYADGELAPEERAEIERAIADDPALAAEVQRHRTMRRALEDAYGPLTQEPVPDHLVALIRRASIAETHAPAPRAVWSPKVRPVQWFALAASLVVGVLVGFSLGDREAPSPSSIVADAGGLVAGGALASALTERIAADPAADGVAMGLSFRDGASAYCRAFIADQLAGFACREGETWRVRMTAEAPSAPSGDFRQAATALPEPVLRAIEDAIVGDPLDAEAERVARDNRWRD